MWCERGPNCRLCLWLWKVLGAIHARYLWASTTSVPHETRRFRGLTSFLTVLRRLSSWNASSRSTTSGTLCRGQPYTALMPYLRHRRRGTCTWTDFRVNAKAASSATEGNGTRGRASGPAYHHEHCARKADSMERELRCTITGQNSRQTSDYSTAAGSVHRETQVLERSFP